jgi:hypothetical protein
MKQDHEKQLKALMDQITCPKDFECYRQRFSNLCKAGDVGPFQLFIMVYSIAPALSVFISLKI